MKTDTVLIQAPPQTYAAWLLCFEELGTRPLKAEEWAYIGQGICTDATSVPFLQERIVEVVNAMLKRITHTFERDVQQYIEEEGCEELYRLFASLAMKLQEALFFESMTVLPSVYRQELAASVRNECRSYWSAWLRSLQNSCMESGDYRLEDQLFMIRRIPLFDT